MVPHFVRLSLRLILGLRPHFVCHFLQVLERACNVHLLEPPGFSDKEHRGHGGHVQTGDDGRFWFDRVHDGNLLDFLSRERLLCVRFEVMHFRHGLLTMGTPIRVEKVQGFVVHSAVGTIGGCGRLHPVLLSITSHDDHEKNESRQCSHEQKTFRTKSLTS